MQAIWVFLIRGIAAYPLLMRKKYVPMRLTPEPFAFLSIAGVGTQALDCDGTVETIVVRSVDDTHASFTELAHDAIPAGCPRVTCR